MERFRLKLLVLMLCVAFCGARELKVKHEFPIYNHTLAVTLVEYASAVYMTDLTQLFTWTCPRCSDLTKGFEILELIVDVQHCLQAFVGVAEDLNSIVIAFRGTQEHSLDCSECDVEIDDAKKIGEIARTKKRNIILSNPHSYICSLYS